jgi:hypothetical protein
MLLFMEGNTAEIQDAPPHKGKTSVAHSTSHVKQKASCKE